ncbi:MAG: hypothetical protein EBU90_15595 [Proteobacteria bacterium]|nr:hypothetical protein [Pseudomonadota bacterium]
MKLKKFLLFFCSATATASISNPADKKIMLTPAKITQLNLSVHFSPEFWYGSNLELLNKNNQADNFSLINYRCDTDLTLKRYNKQHDYHPLVFHVTTRLKGIMGSTGKFNQSTETTLKIGRALIESEHSHSVPRLLLWARELWAQYFFSQDSQQFFKFGIFPYHLGNGFALGNAHLVGQTIPGQLSYQAVDQFRAGLLLSGTAFEKKVHYEGYYGLIKTRNETFETASSFTHAQDLEQKHNPERGAFKKNFLLAAQLNYKPYRNNEEKPYININPYLLLNHDNDAAIEFMSDAQQKLITTGCMLTYQKNNLRLTIECAANHGYQKVKAWDRNIVCDSGTTYQNHLFFVPTDTAGVDFTDPDFATNGVTDPDDFEFATIFTNPSDQSRNYANGQNFALPSTGANYNFFKNSYNRFRKSYKNKYKGWMLYASMQHDYKQLNNTITIGCASGDNNPNDSYEKIMITRLTPGIAYQDSNKHYKGFVGVQELFTTDSMQSYFLYEARKLNRPLFLTNKLTSPSCSNLVFIGLSSKFLHTLHHKNYELRAHLITFFQYTKTKKDYNYHLKDALNVSYSTAHTLDAQKKLDPYLGVELNSSCHITLSEDIKLSGVCALFIPGNYYHDAQGKYVPLAFQVKYAGTDSTGIEDNAEKYNIRLGNQTAFLLSASVCVHFNT